MRINTKIFPVLRGISLAGALLSSIELATPAAVVKSETEFSHVSILVVSPQDGPITPDGTLTLREAIALTNGDLVYSDLTPAERQWVTSRQGSSAISFNLPTDHATIELTAPLPALAQPGLILDGTPPPEHEASAVEHDHALPPIVSITAAPDTSIAHGLTIVADNVTVRGLSLYGFSALHNSTQTTPPADIFITHQLSNSENRQQQLSVLDFSVHDNNHLPSGIVIEQNWLGISPHGDIPETPSAFGVAIFNSMGTTLQQNRIAYHDGSAILTGARAENLQIINNEILLNGLAGMPDGVRLEGHINNGNIQNNLICGNGGSALFMFKPEGAVTIQNNSIHHNGQRFHHAALYVMGNDHRILDNVITDQSGPGVVVTAFSQGGNTHSQRNIILNNRFQRLDGLSIDLNTRHHTDVQDFQIGDGPNLFRESGHRRRDTGNSAINAPRFASTDFFIINGEVLVQGQADPGSEVQLYLSVGNLKEHGPLTQPLATVSVDDFGSFSYRSSTSAPGDILSAIATDPRYGTSEPALNTLISSLTTTLPGPPDLPDTDNSSSVVPLAFNLQDCLEIAPSE